MSNFHPADMRKDSLHLPYGVEPRVSSQTRWRMMSSRSPGR